MQTLQTLSEMAEEITRRAQVKNDLIVPTNKIELFKDDDWKLAIHSQGEFKITENTHSQIATRINIPNKYYNRMLMEAPELLINNVRHWFDQKPERRMLRTLDGNARAFLSDRYLRVDNDQVLQAVLPAILNNDETQVLSCGVTDQKMYLKLLFPNIAAEVKQGDVVRLGLTISNGEIGNGAVSIQSFFYRDFCTNGCAFGVDNAFSFKRSHLGGRLIEGVDYQIISDETRQKDDQALLSQMHDVVKAANSQELFNKMIDKLKESTEGEQIKQPEQAIEVLAKSVGLNETERQQALINLIEDRDYSKWGALNAVTKIANTTESYDRANELESAGNKVLNLSKNEWSRIASAA